MNHVNGDATNPTGTGLRIISHICNNVGLWGRGFVCSLSRRWAQPEQAYRSWYHEGWDKMDGDFELGNVQFVEVEPDIVVANMLAQSGIVGPKNPVPIQYEALADCLWLVGNQALEWKAEVVMPRIGVGLAGGSWPIIEQIIKENLCDRGVVVTVYHYQPRR